MKTCTRCKEQKSIDLFSKNKRYADGLWIHCKPCDAQRVHEYRLKNPEKAKESSLRYVAANKELVAARKKQYRKENADKCKSARREAYAKNRERELEVGRIYKAGNKERIAAANAAKLKANPEMNRFYRSQRRAKERNAQPSWYDPKKIRDLHSEAAALFNETGEVWHVDHIVPLKSDLVCGLHWHGNMQLLPASVNQSKSNRHWPDMP